MSDKDRSFRARDHQPDYVRRNMRDADHARALTTTNRSSIPTRRERFNRGSALVSRLREILVREDAFPRVCHVL
ncbi:MAG TPA: hypothetical protein VM715_18125, partial [Candidatus Acidoferrum sp.]|nr:hypothetical protein [Candidatus Acidoferrum sp.]